MVRLDVSALSPAQADIPSYCTIDRSRLRKRQQPGLVKYSTGSQTLPRRPPGSGRGGGSSVPPPKPIRTRSVDMLDRDPLSCEQSIEDEFKSGLDKNAQGRSLNYIGDCGIDELRRISSDFISDKTPPVKSVKIHPKVTEFHYPGTFYPIT